jgi:outer membrane lipopolysaccharide assembly protein LptE/RlpB
MTLFYPWRWFSLALLLLLTSGCGYHLTNHHSDRQLDAKTIWIPFFGNESVSPVAQTVLRRSFYEEFHAQRGLTPAANEAAADLTVQSRLLSYSNKATSYSYFDKAVTYIVVVEVELALFKNGEKAPFWKGRLSTEKQYPANSNLAVQRNAEDQALDAASRIVAQKLISALEETY